MNSFDDENEKTRLFRPSLKAASGSIRSGSLIDAGTVCDLGGVNPLVAAANPLLLMVATLRVASAPGDVGMLRQRLVGLVKKFDAQCIQQALPDDVRGISRYAVCTLIDEAIQTTPWGAAAHWAQHSLLVSFFKENWGGERFFDYLDEMLKAPGRFIQVLELFYICLALGFTGKYRLADGAAGRQGLVDVRERLFQVIRQGRAEQGRQLSESGKGLLVAARQFRGFGGFWLSAGTVGLLGLSLFAAYSFWLSDRLGALNLQDLALKRTAVSPVVAVPAPVPRLARLLAPEIAAHQVQVRDQAIESVVTLLGETLFESGSAEPSGRSVALLGRVAEALDQVNGSVLVTGHTDNVPSRGLRFSSNHELSQARAQNVRRILAAQMRDSSRITAEGRGETEPVASNDAAEGRAQNRRVDITLRVSTAAQ